MIKNWGARDKRPEEKLKFGSVKMWGGGVWWLIDRCWCQNTNSSCYSNGQNRGGQIRPRLIYSLVGSFSEGEHVRVCVYFYMCIFKVCIAAPLGRQQEKELSQLPTGPLLSFIQHTHAQWQVFVMSYSFTLAGIMRVNAVMSRGAAASSSLWASLHRLDCCVFGLHKHQRGEQFVRKYRQYRLKSQYIRNLNKHTIISIIVSSWFLVSAFAPNGLFPSITGIDKWRGTK